LHCDTKTPRISGNNVKQTYKVYRRGSPRSGLLYVITDKGVSEVAIILHPATKADTKMPKLPVEEVEPEEVIEGDTRMETPRREES
jgi:hypothetical protein